jgi:membrane associated rhomboid family serine protease
LISITSFIIIITCLTSIAAFYNQKLMGDWILSPYMIYHNNQWWRMLTSGLLHADFMHLAINMFVLYMFGSNMELYFKYELGSSGAIYFVLLYFTAIIVANISSVIKNRDNPNYHALGASGATSALVFAFVILDPWGKTIGFFFIPPGLLPNIAFGALYLIYCVYMSKRGGDNIGHEAHFYGAIWGAFFMFATQPYLIKVFLDKLI